MLCNPNLPGVTGLAGEGSGHGRRVECPVVGRFIGFRGMQTLDLFGGRSR